MKLMCIDLRRKKDEKNVDKLNNFFSQLFIQFLKITYMYNKEV